MIRPIMDSDYVLEHAEALPVRSGQSNARLNKNVLRRDLKTDKLGLDKTVRGSEFQIDGAATRNARAAKSVRTLGMFNS